MSLTNLPKVKPSKGTVYVMAVLLATFAFFFTRAESPPKPRNKEDDDDDGIFIRTDAP